MNASVYKIKNGSSSRNPNSFFRLMGKSFVLNQLTILFHMTFRFKG